MNKITTPADLADLAEFKHRVPDGTQAPGQPALRLSTGGQVFIMKDGANIMHVSGFTYWTREPLDPTRPNKLPTARGSVITNVCTQEGARFPTAFRIDSDTIPWAALDHQGYHWLFDDDIFSFDYTRIVPNGVGVLDEDDKSPVVDRDGDTWNWCAEIALWSGGVLYRGTKAAIDQDFGPLRPADKGGQS